MPLLQSHQHSRISVLTSQLEVTCQSSSIARAVEQTFLKHKRETEKRRRESGEEPQKE